MTVLEQAAEDLAVVELALYQIRNEMAADWKLRVKQPLTGPLLRPEMPRCAVLYPRPCRFPANARFGLCGVHFRQYYGHDLDSEDMVPTKSPDFPRGYTWKCSNCGWLWTWREEAPPCPHNPRAHKLAERI